MRQRGHNCPLQTLHNHEMRANAIRQIQKIQAELSKHMLNSGLCYFIAIIHNNMGKHSTSPSPPDQPRTLKKQLKLVTSIKPLKAIGHDTVINSWQHQSSHSHCLQDPRYGGEDTHGKTNKKPEVRKHQVDISGKKPNLIK